MVWFMLFVGYAADNRKCRTNRQQADYNYLTDCISTTVYNSYKVEFVPRQDGGNRASVFTS
ncbi:hypothetical protein HanPSC8_Chr05g0187681 [Helianthus annuus]|nr:hypothetical protein HanPSC8_Chr05g0187681 [Helianthus annuus]